MDVDGGVSERNGLGQRLDAVNGAAEGGAAAGEELLVGGQGGLVGLDQQNLGSAAPRRFLVQGAAHGQLVGRCFQHGELDA